MTAPEVELSIVLPCYNEAPNLPLLLKRYNDLRETFPFELILVNNGSTDNSAAILAQELKKPEYRFAGVVTIEKNQGYGHGIMTGLREAKGRILAFSHADMQCDAKDVFIGYHKLIQNPDPENVLVKGRRIRRQIGESLFTMGMTALATLILRRTLADVNAQPKVFHKHLLEHFSDPPIGLEFDLYCLYSARRLGIKIDTIPVYFTRRIHGESKWAFNPMSKIRHILGMIRYMFQLAVSADQKIRLAK